MNCRMTRGIYLRANGEINCYCSTGEQVTLDMLPLDRSNWHFVDDHYLKGRFRQIRTAFSKESLPFPDQCAKCNYLASQESFDASLVEREVEWLHIEPAAVCNLRCPFCVHGIPSGERTWARPKPHLLPRILYTKLLDDLKDRNMNVRWMYFSGRGEPGLHPEIWDMVAEAKSKMDTNFLVNTNGNIPYDDMIVDSGLDKIKIALDSLDPDTYSRYRRGGMWNVCST
ncbi:radical SAM protein [Salidesulfovibrio onnuriiensis]|uniref:radical SAM protein n=1 Tax=Salidesulfovibrio onnuriiensis TaxID=2583823 RepID=UPI0011C839EE|nr:radical SAM protein [Salidesulfovibrio onnuriiensis]